MVVKNIGQVLSSWQFAPKFDETVISMPWLSFNPMKGILAPGEVTCCCLPLTAIASNHHLRAFPVNRIFILLFITHGSPLYYVRLLITQRVFTGDRGDRITMRHAHAHRDCSLEHQASQ